MTERDHWLITPICPRYALSWWPEESLGNIHKTIADLDIRLIYTPTGRSQIGLVIEGAETIGSVHSGFLAGLRD